MKMYISLTMVTKNLRKDGDLLTKVKIEKISGKLTLIHTLLLSSWKIRNNGKHVQKNNEGKGMALIMICVLKVIRKEL